MKSLSTIRALKGANTSELLWNVPLCSRDVPLSYKQRENLSTRQKSALQLPVGNSRSGDGKENGKNQVKNRSRKSLESSKQLSNVFTQIQ